jgi:hypothetical protein
LLVVDCSLVDAWTTTLLYAWSSTVVFGNAQATTVDLSNAAAFGSIDYST